VLGRGDHWAAATLATTHKVVGLNDRRLRKPAIEGDTALFQHLLNGRHQLLFGKFPEVRLALPQANTISGTPTTVGTFTFTVRVTDDLGAFSDKVHSVTIS
jgi:hypothetical protein